MSKPRRSVFLSTAFATLLVGLVGCSSSGVIEQDDDVAVDDVTGCPVLSGRYAVAAPDRDTGVSLDGSAWTTRQLADGEMREGVGRLEDYGSVQVTTLGTHGIEMRFAYPHHEVMAALERIREYERPRYAEFYRLMQPAPRAAFVAGQGEAALQARMVELGPRTGHAVSFERNRDYTCEDGWMLFPREHLGPLRMTVDKSGALAFQSKELSTYEFMVWCGDGCKGFPIPTGSYTGTMRWPADASNPEWNADEVARSFVFLRPADWVEAEQENFAVLNQRNAERQYARPEAVREALAPLLPEGISIADITITTLPGKGARVRVHAVPSDPAMPSEQQNARLEWFLAALREGDPSFIEDSEVVKRVISGGGPLRHEFEIFLDTHPAVQPRTIAEGSAAPETTSVMYLPPPAVPAQAAAQTGAPPVGFASLSALESRLAPHLAAGCRIADLSYAGEAVVMKGSAQTMQCVSDTMRAIDRSVPEGGSRIELMQIAAAEGGYSFEIRLPESALTKA